MLASAYSSDANLTVMAIGAKEATYPNVIESTSENKYEITPRVHHLNELDSLILNTAEKTNHISLYIGIISVVNGENLSCEALEKIENIYLIPEGTSIFEYTKEHIKKIITFKDNALNCGLKNINLILWDSINENTLLNSDYAIAQLPQHAIGYEFVNFNEMAKKIKHSNNQSALISSLFYSESIALTYLNNNVFKQNETYDNKKENIVLLGSYSNDTASYYNQINLLSALENKIDKSKYNLIYKGHPKDISVNHWIDKNSSSISYFNAFPYEIWQVLGEGEYHFTYENSMYSLSLPSIPKEINGIFSTLFYAQDSSTIKNIFAFNLLDKNNNLTPEIHPDSIEDKKEVQRWQTLTMQNKVSFHLIYDWLNKRSNAS